MATSLNWKDLRIPFKIVFAFLFLTRALFAESLPPVVVTADKQEVPLENVSESVTIITREQMQEEGVVHVIESLRNVVGVDVIQTGAAGDDTDIRIRGSDRDEVLVLIDGVSINNITEHRPSILGAIPVDNIERIEVVRGSQSILYGSDAVGGVINIITRKGARKPTAGFSFEGGNLQTFRELAQYAGSTEKTQQSLTFSRVDQEGRFDRDRFGEFVTSGKFSYRANPQLQLSTGVDYFRTNQELFSEFLTTFDPGTGRLVVKIDPDLNRQLNTDLVVAHGSAKLLPQPWWSFEMIYGLLVDLENLDNPSMGDVAPPGFTVGSQDFSGRGFEHSLDFRNFFDLHDSQRLKAQFTAGFEVNSEELHFTDPPTVFPAPGQEGDRQNYAPYFQQMFSFFDDSLILSGGARFDHNTTFGSEWSPRGSILYKIKKTGTTLRGNYGEGFHAPTLLEFFNEVLLKLTDDPAFQAIRLQPELSQSYDAGVEQKLGKWGTASATFFYLDFDKLFDGLQFISDAFATGVESSLEIHPWNWLSFGGNYTFTKSLNEATHQRLSDRPAHLWKAFVSTHPLPRWTLRADLNIVTDRKIPDTISTSFGDLGVSFIDENGNPSGTNLAGYAKLDLASSFELLKEKKNIKNWRIYGKIQNLLNDSYQEKFGFPAPGITFLAGSEVRF